jgi:thiol-disulfide isomerase/thioredoxin
MEKSARMTNGAAAPRPPRSGRRGRAIARARTKRRRRALTVLVLFGVVALALGITFVSRNGGQNPGTSSSAPAVGVQAPQGVYTSVHGDTASVSSLRGTPMLVWFVATWCSSCQAGTQAMAQHIDQFSSHHVRVVELELAGDLGQPGPTIASFGQQFAGHEYTNSDWSWGVASSQMTATYDPHTYLDIYYLLNAQGKIVYINSSPGSTMGSLLQAVGALPA